MSFMPEETPAPGPIISGQTPATMFFEERVNPRHSVPLTVMEASCDVAAVFVDERVTDVGGVV